MYFKKKIICYIKFLSFNNYIKQESLDMTQGYES